MVQNLSPEIDSNKLFTHFSRVSHAIFSIYSAFFYKSFSFSLVKSSGMPDLMISPGIVIYVAFKVLASCVMKTGAVVVSGLYHTMSLNMVRFIRFIRS